MRELFRAESVPYAVVVPYATWDVAGISVVQLIVAELDETGKVETELITGAPVTVVLNVKFVDVASVPAEFVESTA